MTFLTVPPRPGALVFTWGGIGFSAELSRGRVCLACSPEPPRSHFLLLWGITSEQVEIKQASSGRREFPAGRPISSLFRSDYFAGVGGNGGVNIPIRMLPLSTTLAGEA
jgi:hypothetical protein